ncbi:MAG: hypothetical protein KDA42_04805 [Planctomycetales bacterium]|nr:hypothetical protein [Planctomycetales bacterium]
MKDPDYAAKYTRPYRHGERYPRMAKQMIDARHVAGKRGGYLNAVGQGSPFTVGGEIGGFDYPTSYIEHRVGLMGLLGTATARDEPAAAAIGGLNFGVRVQSPSRIAPFAGVGVFGGYGAFDVPADDDGIDNDDDFFIDERNEIKESTDFYAAVYPELGVHAWLNSRVRLTGSAGYQVSTEGRDHDGWMVGLSIALLEPPDPPCMPYIPSSPDATPTIHNPNYVIESANTIERLPPP